MRYKISFLVGTNSEERRSSSRRSLKAALSRARTLAQRRYIHSVQVTDAKSGRIWHVE